MSTIRPAVCVEEANRLVDEYQTLANRLYQERLFDHPFVRGLQAGTVPEHQLRAFLLNWYTFALEVNTAASTVYHRYVSFFKTHPRLEDLITSTISEEFSEPGPGGHIRTVQRTAETVGLTWEQLVHARLFPEARAWVDFHVRLLREGTLAEVAADFICEGEFGHFARILFEALTSRYGFSPQAADYFREHHESDAVGKPGQLSHGDRGRALLQGLLVEGLVEERAGCGVEYTIDVTVGMFELLLDGVLRRFPQQSDPALSCTRVSAAP